MSLTRTPEQIYYFFDGTLVNLYRECRSIVGDIFISMPAVHAYIDINTQEIKTAANENKSTITDKVKFYFPGPGANASNFEGVKYKSPGRESIKNISSHLYSGIKSSIIYIKNGITGDGWEYSLAKSILAAAAISTLNSSKIKHFIFGYSRGAITAIAFSNELSDLLKSNDEIYVFILDPVAGGNYSHLDNLKKCKGVTSSGFKCINPFWIGTKVKTLDIFYACTETRDDFLPQLPYYYDKKSNLKYINNRPLFIPDSVDTKVHFLYADHWQLACSRDSASFVPFFAGHYTYNTIVSKINKLTNSNILKVDNTTSLTPQNPGKIAFYYFKKSLRVIANRSHGNLFYCEDYNKISCFKEALLATIPYLEHEEINVIKSEEIKILCALLIYAKYLIDTRKVNEISKEKLILVFENVTDSITTYEKTNSNSKLERLLDNILSNLNLINSLSQNSEHLESIKRSITDEIKKERLSYPTRNRSNSTSLISETRNRSNSMSLILEKAEQEFIRKLTLEFLLQKKKYTNFTY